MGGSGRDHEFQSLAISGGDRTGGALAQSARGTMVALVHAGLDAFGHDAATTARHDACLGFALSLGWPGWLDHLLSARPQALYWVGDGADWRNACDPAAQ